MGRWEWKGGIFFSKNKVTTMGRINGTFEVILSPKFKYDYVCVWEGEVSLCMCVYVCVREIDREKGETDRNFCWNLLASSALWQYVFIPGHGKLHKNVLLCTIGPSRGRQPTDAAFAHCGRRRSERPNRACKRQCANSEAMADEVEQVSLSAFSFALLTRQSRFVAV